MSVFRPRIVGIVQMRMGSSRLPGKMMKDLGPTDVVGLAVGRMSRARLLDGFVVATTDSPLDDSLAARCDELEVPVYRGSEDDVLDRFYQAARFFSAEAVVRLTGDCPFHDPEVIDLVIQAYLDGQGRLAYVNNVIPPTYPDGLDVEVVPFSALEEAWREATKESERQHVTPYIWKQPERFPQQVVKSETDLSHLRWTLDEDRDLEFITRTLARLKGDPFGFKTSDVLRILDREPELLTINQAITRNEGYALDLAREEGSGVLDRTLPD